MTAVESRGWRVAMSCNTTVSYWFPRVCALQCMHLMLPSCKYLCNRCQAFVFEQHIQYAVMTFSWPISSWTLEGASELLRGTFSEPLNSALTLLVEWQEGYPACKKISHQVFFQKPLSNPAKPTEIGENRLIEGRTYCTLLSRCDVLEQQGVFTAYILLLIMVYYRLCGRNLQGKF